MTKKRETQPEMLLEFLDTDSLRHPMWTPPKPEDRLAVHIRSLRSEIAARLTFFDGAPGWGLALRYIEDVYDVTTREEFCDNYLWVLGQIAWLRVRDVRSIDVALRAVAHPESRRQRELRTNRANIESLCEHFTQATVRDIHAGR